MNRSRFQIFLSLLAICTCISCTSYRLSPEYRDLLLTNQQIKIGGIKRSYHLFNPSQKANSPIIFLFHGNGGSADNIAGLSHVKAPYVPWFDIAVNEGLILVIPDGTIGPKNSQGWNDCRNDAPRIPASDDVGFITTLLDTLKTIPHRMTAFASIVASGPANSKCNTSTIPVSALFMNGTADPLVPYLGGNTENGTVISTDSSIAYWVKRNGTQTAPIITEFPQKSSSKVIAYRYAQGVNGTEVMLYKVEGGGHIEPSRRERYSFLWTAFAGTQNGDIESAEEIWSFFKQKVRK